ncbi:MAG: cytochrome c-type biogenesis protein [Planctomycetota bacterium]
MTSRRYTVTLTLLALLAGSGAAWAPDSPLGQQTEEPAPVEAVRADPELEAQVREIAAQLRCPTCRALSVQDSPSGMAQEMRDLIREQLLTGKTPEEVTAYFVERYGEWILLKPTAQGFNWTVWLLPILMLAGGFFFVIMTARRWVEQGRARAAELADDAEESEL